MPATIRRIVTAGLCLAAGLAGTVLLSPAAQAAPGLTGKELVSGSSTYSSAPKKTAKATCPAGKAAISAGAFVQGPLHVRITLIRAVGDGNYGEAAAVNPQGRAPWSLHAYVLCADPPKGLTYTAASSSPTQGPFRSALAKCPDGKQLLGIGGLAAAEQNRNVTLSVVIPPGGLTHAWVGSTAAEGGEADPWTTQAYATCADPLGATLVTADGPKGLSDTTQMNSASCLPGKLAAIGGAIQASVPANTGQVGFGGLYPDATLSEGVVIANEDHNGYAGTWTVGAWAICA
jgi:hypothetical protein